MLLPRPALFAAALFALALCARAEVKVTQSPGWVSVHLNGRPFTQVMLRGAPHVFYWPLMGPGELRVTRAFPMEELPDEEHDHPHHRSMWFSHGLVNGIDFWSEAASHGARQPKQPIGRILHDRIIETKSGAKEGSVTTAQNWVAPDGTIPLTSTQTLRVFAGPANEREFEFATTLSAGSSDVTFGDTKEGTFALRIAETMRLRKGRGAAGEGHILTSEGVKDDKVWGTRAKWVAMWGPVKGKVMTIAIMDHPSNLRHPTRWHARDYGLFAANPFCEHEMDKSKPAGAGDFKLDAGKSLTLRYRVVIYDGPPDEMDERFAAFAKE